jgi:MoxR-like ATPase
MTVDGALPPCWADLVDALAAGIDRVILYGPPGCGKTYAGLTLGVGPGGAHRLICATDMTAADVTGHWMPAADGTWAWRDGAVVKAWHGDGTLGGRVVAGEIDQASGDVLSTLLAMFDTVASARWDHPATGEILTPRPGFSVVMTTNVDDLADLPAALTDRFPVRIRIDTPHPDALDGLSADLRHAAATVADADPDRRFSVRAFGAFDQLRPHIGLERAARLVFGDAADDIVDALTIAAAMS